MMIVRATPSDTSSLWHIDTNNNNVPTPTTIEALCGSHFTPFSMKRLDIKNAKDFKHKILMCLMCVKRYAN